MKSWTKKSLWAAALGLLILGWATQFPARQARLDRAASRSLPHPPDLRHAVVSEVIDGDTVLIDGTTYVRLIGIDAPETHASKKMTYDLERSRLDAATMSALGRQSQAALEGLILGKAVDLDYEADVLDDYGRLLAYLWSDEVLVNAWLVERGWARAYTRFDFRYRNEFEKLEEQAVIENRGIWRDVSPREF